MWNSAAMRRNELSMDKGIVVESTYFKDSFAIAWKKATSSCCIRWFISNKYAVALRMTLWFINVRKLRLTTGSYIYQRLICIKKLLFSNRTFWICRNWSYNQFQKGYATRYFLREEVTYGSNNPIFSILHLAYDVKIKPMSFELWKGGRATWRFSLILCVASRWMLLSSPWLITMWRQFFCLHFPPLQHNLKPSNPCTCLLFIAFSAICYLYPHLKAKWLYPINGSPKATITIFINFHWFHHGIYKLVWNYNWWSSLRVLSHLFLQCP